MQNANSRDLKHSPSQLPDVSGAVMRNMQYMIFEKMQRSMVDGRMQSIPIKFQTMASLQPLSPKQLKLKPEGNRAWSWYMIHSLTDLELKVNDRFSFNGKKFKAMGKESWNQYGYFYYECIEDVQDDQG